VPLLRFLRACLVAAAASAALGGCGDETMNDPHQTVLRSERVWVDGARVTPPTKNFRGAPQRTLRTLIWQPLEMRPLPLLIMAHGFGGLPEKFAAFARTVAAAGFVVAAPAFPLTNENAPGGHDVGLGDFVNQPADISFVISKLLAANDTAGDALHGHIRAADVAGLGHSLGGLTTIGLTRKNCCRDGRVRASILVAAVAALADAYGIDSIHNGPPTLIIHGTADPTVPFESSLQLYDAIHAPRFFLGLAGATHSEDLESQTQPAIVERDAAQRATIAFLNATLRGAHAELNDTFAALVQAGDIVQSDEAGL